MKSMVEVVQNLLKPYIDSQIQTLTNVTQVKRVIAVSDSYGKGRGGQTPWTTYLQTYLGLSNSDFYAWSEGSMGFNATGEDGHTAIQLMQSNANLVTNPETISHVIIGMGLNDSLALTNLNTAIDSCISYIKTTYPNAKIYIGYIGNFRTKSGAVFGDYMSSLKEYIIACGRNGVAYINGVENIMHNNKFFLSDGVHPTTDGGANIGAYIASYLKGGAKCVFRTVDNVATDYFGTARLNAIIDNDVVSLKFLLPACTSTFNMTINTPAAIGVISDPLIDGIAGNTHYANCLMYDNNTSSYIPCMWYIADGKVYILPSANITITSGASSHFAIMSYPTIEA